MTDTCYTIIEAVMVFVCLMVLGSSGSDHH